MIDGVVIGIVGLNAILGFWRGLAHSIIGVLAVAVGGWMVWQYGQTPIPFLRGYGGEWMDGVGWFMGGYVMVRLGGMALTSLLPTMGLGLPNRVLGLGVGLVKGVAIACFLLILLQLINPSAVQGATSSAVLFPIVEWVMRTQN